MELSFKKEVTGELEPTIARVSEILMANGFGILTRIDFHLKMKEKLGKDLPPVVILGACNPKIAYEAYCVSTDVTSLIPCNAVVREIGPKRYSVELTKPSALLKPLGDEKLVQAATAADASLAKALKEI